MIKPTYFSEYYKTDKNELKKLYCFDPILKCDTGFNVEPPHEIEHKGAESLEIAKLNQDCYKVYILNNKS